MPGLRKANKKTKPAFNVQISSGFIRIKYMTKVNENLETRKNIIARMMKGIEPFYINGEKWVDAFGHKVKFNEADTLVQSEILRCYGNDEQSHRYMEHILCITDEGEKFETWYRCVVGGLDKEPDIINGVFNPDKFNNLCFESICSHRGKFCGTRSGLKDYEVETLTLLKQGHTIEQGAQKIHVSVPGFKSRIDNLKIRLGATNMAALISIASDLGM
jgi:DNA-binding CsgD family transcriptional regulator